MSNPLVLRFMGAIQHLQGLFSLARTIDKQKVGFEQGERRLATLVDSVGDFTSDLYTRGPILPDVDIEFRLPVVSHQPDGRAAIEEERASFSLRVGRVTTSWSVEQTSTRGEVRNRESTPEELQATRFSVELGWLEVTSIE